MPVYMTETNEVSYPNIKQSWGITGIAVLLMIALTPVNLLLNYVVEKNVSFLVYYVLTMGLTFWIFHRKRTSKTAERGYNFQPGTARVMVLLAICVIALQIGILSPIVELIPMPEMIKKIFEDLAGRTDVFSFIAIVIAAPILEELLFRGIVLHGLLKRYSPVRSIIISSMLFGIVHLNPWQFIPAFILGILSGWVYSRTGKLTLSILIHMVNNLMAFISMTFWKEYGSLDVSLTELYGGPVNMALVILAAVGVAVTCLYFLRRDLTESRADL
jgi:uncharacterized protein